MSAIISTFLAMIPRALIAIGANIFTEPFIQAVIEKVIIFGLRKLVALTSNTMDDQIAADIIARIEGTHNVTTS